MSISPAISALRTTGVAPSAVRSTVWMPAALSNSRIICPIITDSLESFEETTTAACDGLGPPSASSAATIRQFRSLSNFDKQRLHRADPHKLSVVDVRVKPTTGAAAYWGCAVLGLRCTCKHLLCMLKCRDREG